MGGDEPRGRWGRDGVVVGRLLVLAQGGELVSDEAVARGGEGGGRRGHDAGAAAVVGGGGGGEGRTVGAVEQTVAIDGAGAGDGDAAEHPGGFGAPAEFLHVERGLGLLGLGVLGLEGADLGLDLVPPGLEGGAVLEDEDEGRELVFHVDGEAHLAGGGGGLDLPDVADVDAAFETEDALGLAGEGVATGGAVVAEAAGVGEETAETAFFLFNDADDGLAEEVDEKLADEGLAADGEEVVHQERTEVGQRVALPVDDAIPEIFCDGVEGRVLLLDVGELFLAGWGRGILGGGGGLGIRRSVLLALSDLLLFWSGAVGIDGAKVVSGLETVGGPGGGGGGVGVGHDGARDVAGDALGWKLDDDDAGEGLGGVC